MQTKSTKPFNPEKIRDEFPFFKANSELCYLDNASTSQKPASVIEAECQIYERFNANVHRGAYQLSAHCTNEYEGVREKVSKFLGVTPDPREVIFTSGTTASLNLVMNSFGRNTIQEGDVIAVTRMEHHANFIPWQQLSIEKKARFEIVEIDEEGRLSGESLERVLNLNPKIFSLSAMSNVLGTVNPLPEIISRAKEKGAVVVLDAAQSVAHLPMNPSFYGSPDFIAFSGHKIGAPTGTGVLWGRRNLLEKMPPVVFGGDMIKAVRDQETSWNDLPWKFEAGTPHYAGVIGLGAAIGFLQSIGMEEIESYEKSLTPRVLKKIQSIPGVKIHGPKTSEMRGSVFCFSVEGIHPHDLATFLDAEKIALRAGHHCAQPLHRSLGTPSSARASFAFYNLESEADRLVKSLGRAIDYFKTGRKLAVDAFEAQGRA